MALVQADLSIGQRSGTFKQSGSSGKTLSAQTIELAGHLDPLPLIPVAFGVRVIADSHNAKISDHGFKSMTATAIVPELKAWLSLFGDIAPFVRVGYTALSTYKATAEVTVGDQVISGDVVLKSTGPRLALGVQYDVIPLVSILGAVEHSTETLSYTSGKIGGFDFTEEKNITYSNTAILVGVKAGI
jgi:hypothetical protein